MPHYVYKWSKLYLLTKTFTNKQMQFQVGTLLITIVRLYCSKLVSAQLPSFSLSLSKLRACRAFLVVESL